MNRALAILLLALFGCTPKGGASASTPRWHFTDAELQRIVQMTAWARQLDVKRPVNVERLDVKRFVERVREGDEQDAGEEEKAVRTLLGFNLVPPLDAQDAIASTDDILAEQVVGFYDRKIDKIFLPNSGFTSRSEELKERGIFAHEVHHALQAQHFDMEAISKAEGDVGLAHLALIEGDAMVTMAAYFGADYGKPIHRTIRTISDIRIVSAEDVADRGSELANALPLTREMLLFPYDQGMLFVSDIFRTGGFDLVNQLYQRPPMSTAQVIHPEKYIAGELPAQITLPPATFETVAEGQLGELRSRVMLAQCNEAPRAATAASGWRGDAYRAGRRQDGGTVIEWLVVLDTSEDAEELESALKDEGCWKANRVGTVFVEAGGSVQREDNRVALVRGLSAERTKALLAAEVVLPIATPIGDFSVPPRTPLPKYQPGTISGPIYRSEWLGIEGQLPSGMKVKVGRAEDDIELEIKRDRRSFAALFVSDRITDKRYVEAVFDDILDGLTDVVDRSLLTRPVTSSGRGPLGKGIVRSWTIINTGVDVRAILIPICNGTGSLVFLQIFSDKYSRQVVDGWLNSFRWVREPDTAPACQRLDPR